MNPEQNNGDATKSGGILERSNKTTGTEEQKGAHHSETTYEMQVRLARAAARQAAVDQDDQTIRRRKSCGSGSSSSGSGNSANTSNSNNDSDSDTDNRHRDGAEEELKQDSRLSKKNKTVGPSRKKKAKKKQTKTKKRTGSLKTDAPHSPRKAVLIPDGATSRTETEAATLASPMKAAAAIMSPVGASPGPGTDSDAMGTSDASDIDLKSFRFGRFVQ